MLPGEDFSVTSAPVSKYTSARTVLAIANDLETEFFDEVLEDEIYKKLRPGYRVGNQRKVCKLRK